MLALSLSLWLTVAAAAPADCVQSVDASTLLATVEAAESAYEDLDEDGFLEHMDKLALGLPCLVDVVDAPSAARIHRTLAVGLFATDRDRARAHVSAARAVAPDLGVKPLVSDQHPLARAWELPPPQGVRPLPPPLGHVVYVDGVASRHLPDERAALLQVVASDDRVTSTHVVYPRQVVPDYPQARSWKTPLRIGALATGAVSVALYGVAAASAASFDAPDRDADQLRRLATTTNGSLVASGATATVALGLLSASFVVR